MSSPLKFFTFEDFGRSSTLKPSPGVIQLLQVVYRSLSPLALPIKAFFRIHTRLCYMSPTGSPRPSGLTSNEYLRRVAMADRRRPFHTSITSIQDSDLSSTSTPRTSAMTTQSIRRRLELIGLDRDRRLHDLNTCVQNLTLELPTLSRSANDRETEEINASMQRVDLETYSAPSRPAMDRKTQELIRRLNPQDPTEADLISVLQDLYAQPSLTRTRNNSQIVYLDGFAPYPARSRPTHANEKAGSQPTSPTHRNYQQFVDRMRPKPYRARAGISTMLLLDPQSPPLGEGFNQEVGLQMNDNTNASQRAEPSPKFGGTLRVQKSQEKLSPTLYGTKRGATQGQAKEAEIDISTATTEEGWEIVAPSRGNGFTTGTLNRLDELRAQRQKAFEEYMEETAEWLCRADEKLAKYRSKSEAFRDYQRSRSCRSENRTGDDSINRREQRTVSTEENGARPTHDEAKPPSKDACLYCLNDKCEGCLGR